MATDRLGALDDVIEQIKDGFADSPRSVSQIRRTAHNLKGMGARSDFP